MTSEKRYWLLLEKSDETRISKGIDGYMDRTGTIYSYDSLVPNHKNLAEGDALILRRENEILGIGTVGSIKERAEKKRHRRCPACESTDIRQRSKKLPRWKCGKCGHEFAEPVETTTDVIAFTADVQNFMRLQRPPSVKAVKSCVHQGEGIASQLSMLRLDPERIEAVLDGSEATNEPADRVVTTGQGFGLTKPERDAVEKRAMAVAQELYEGNGWNVKDKSATRPFDLLAVKDDQKRFVEAKGTTGPGTAIILTQGEVEHVRHYASESALVVVSQIILSKVGDRWIATGGVVSAHLDSWVIAPERLKATRYRYEL